MRLSPEISPPDQGTFRPCLSARWLFRTCFSGSLSFMKWKTKMMLKVSTFFFNPHPRIRLLILEKEKRREREITVREKYLSVASHTGDRTLNLGMCPDQESNLRPFGARRRHSNQLSHPARAIYVVFNPFLKIDFFFPLKQCLGAIANFSFSIKIVFYIDFCPVFLP